jgi:hypothetical protein
MAKKDSLTPSQDQRPHRLTGPHHPPRRRERPTQPIPPDSISRLLQGQVPSTSTSNDARR